MYVTVNYKMSIVKIKTTGRRCRMTNRNYITLGAILIALLKIVLAIVIAFTAV